MFQVLYIFVCFKQKNNIFYFWTHHQLTEPKKPALYNLLDSFIQVFIIFFFILHPSPSSLFQKNKNLYILGTEQPREHREYTHSSKYRCGFYVYLVLIFYNIISAAAFVICLQVYELFKRFASFYLFFFSVLYQYKCVENEIRIVK